MRLSCNAAVAPSLAPRGLAMVAALLCALTMSTAVRADLVVPAGGFVSLGSGALDLGCTDLIVGGTLQTNSAPVVNVRNVIIQSGGTLDAGSSDISVGGDWSNGGTFIAGTSQVLFVDVCGTSPATITGNTSFYDVSFVSVFGKTWLFASGSTQTVIHMLNAHGTPANPITFRSTIPGQVATIRVQGTQSISDLLLVDVMLSALLPGITQPIPALGPLGIVLLILLMTVMAATPSLRRRQKSTRGNQ